ncbi:hypothetical protein N7539_000753 [Penicillium diatomitis]|uniref:Uncharacterized protein n=1 Tax=Penicillium diatomitis TaxID=2819901 RepID=A0A9X0C2I2_9EURO|nr:uncharacterized protein N7539_000753 [Penicillium diatomitis]KAJ5495637.1 hypothetical protein N7539_000753 [Penicillium diatomitis]
MPVVIENKSVSHLEPGRTLDPSYLKSVQTVDSRLQHPVALLWQQVVAVAHLPKLERNHNGPLHEYH